MASSEKPRIDLRMLAADPRAALSQGISRLAGWRYEMDDLFLDGPVTRRLAVLDFDPRTGLLVKGAEFVPAPKGRKLARYKIEDENDLDAADVQQVSLFTTVLRTLEMFEESDVLGRKVAWAFEGEQLLLVPRAGDARNAFYHRDSRSLNFFFFDVADGAGGKRRIYTCLSPDIIAHETAHAVIDAIAPDLYHAVSPQSLALHEALADLTAVMLAMRVDLLARAVLERTDGDLRKASAFDELAEQFGEATRGFEGRTYLRKLRNDDSLNPAWGTRMMSREPHDLSLVLSGALYELLLELHDRDKKRIAADEGTTERSASGKALFTARGKFKRMVLRALDYLPPGEISFADYGRAIVAADRDFNPDDGEPRNIVTEIFVRRGMIGAAADIAVPGEYPSDALAGADLDELVASDWFAYRFAEANRDLLHIPPVVPFKLRARLVAEKSRTRTDGSVDTRRQCILKVSWDALEKNAMRDPLADSRSITFGSTMVIDVAAGRIATVLSTNPALRAEEGKGQAADRDAHLQKLIDTGRLFVVPAEATGDTFIPPDNPVARISNDVMRVFNSAHMLHIAGSCTEGEEP